MANNISKELDFEYKPDNKKASDIAVIWNQEKIKEATAKVNHGIPINPNPFFGRGSTKYRRGDIVYEYTDEELKDFKKVMKSPLYFAKNHAYLRTPYGNKRVELRDYQEDLINTFSDFKDTIVMSSRQMGKCVDFFTKITIKYNGEEKEVYLGDLYFLSLGKLSFLDWCKKGVYNIIKYLKRYDL